MPYVDIIDGRLVVDAPYAQRELVKSIPGMRWSSATKQWSAEPSWGICQALRGVFGQTLEIGPYLRDWSWETYDRIKNVLDLRVLVEYPDNDPRRVDKNLHPFQEVGRDFLVQSREALLGDEMGTGKTVQTLSALRLLIKSGSTPQLPAIVVCPNGAKDHWRRHIEEWLPEATPYVLDGTSTARRKTLDHAAEDETAIVISNIEGLRLFSRLAPYGSVTLKKCAECEDRVREEYETPIKPAQCEAHKKELNNIDFRVCILDEAHRIKNPQAKQTRAIWAVFHQPSVQYRWALTGTPIANHPGDLWAILHAISPTDFPTKSKFIDRYALNSFNAFGGLDIIGLNPSTKEEFFRIFDPHFRRITKDIVLPYLPKKVRYTYKVDMTPKQKKAYKDLSEHLVTKLDSGKILIAASNLVAQVRLLQLSSSYCEVDIDGDPDNPENWSVAMKEPSTKIDALVELLDDLQGKPVAIVAEYRQFLEITSERLEKHKIDHVMYTGGISLAQRTENLRRFQNGETNVILFTYKAGGVGLDMTRADTLIRLQRSWSLIDNKQGEDRVHRIGSEKHNSINIIDVISSDTIEEDQLKTLNEKLRRLEEITRDRESRLANGLDISDLDQEESQIYSSTLLGGDNDV